MSCTFWNIQRFFVVKGISNISFSVICVWFRYCSEPLQYRHVFQIRVIDKHCPFLVADLQLLNSSHEFIY